MGILIYKEKTSVPNIKILIQSGAHLQTFAWHQCLTVHARHPPVTRPLLLFASGYASIKFLHADIHATIVSTPTTVA
jgi:hypothetical protein